MSFSRIMAGLAGVFFTATLGFLAWQAASAQSEGWAQAWPDTDFSITAIDLAEIMSGGVGKDQIPAIDNPLFISVAQENTLEDNEPVVAVVLDGTARAYPLRILTWHEIVNDQIGETPLAITYCPLCNAALVFDTRVLGPSGESLTLDFGTTGKLRNSDLVMYDRQTQSWWQQFLGQALVGTLTGTQLTFIPSRLESWASFKARFPDGEVLVPNDPGLRPYGSNPYVGYDSAARPFLYGGEVPEGIAPLAYVVAVGEEAWSLALLQSNHTIKSDDLVLTWAAGMASALDTRTIAEGRDIGNITVQRETDQGLVDVAYDVTFAFVFHAFRPEGTLHR